MRQSYEKKQHEARKNEKKTHATSRKPTRKKESQHPQHNRQSHHRRRPRPTPNEPPRTPPIFEFQRPPRQKPNAKTKDRAGEAAGRRRLGLGALLGMSRGKATRPPAANAPLWLGREPTKFPWGFCKESCVSGPGTRAGRCAPPVGFNLFFEPSVTNYWILLGANVGLP